MPKIPGYTSQNRLSTQGSAPTINPGSLNAAGNATKQVGKDLDAVNQKFVDMRNMSEYTTAMTGANQRLGDLTLEAENDNDIYTMESRYQEEFQKVRSEALESISSNSVRQKLEFQLDTAVQSKMHDIKRVSRTKQIEQARFQLDEYLTTSKEGMINAGNALEQSRLRNDTFDLIDANVKLGAVDPVEAQKLKKSFLGDVAVSSVREDIRLDPEFAYKNLLKPDFYENIPHGDKAKLIEEAQAALTKLSKDREKARKDTQSKNAIEATRMLWNNELTTDKLEDMMVGEQIDLTMAEKLRKAITTDKSDDEGSDKAFVDFSLRYNSLFEKKKKGMRKQRGVDSEDIKEFIGDVAAARGDGLLDKADAQKWTEQAVKILEPMLDKEAKQEYRDYKRLKKQGMLRISQWADSVDIKDKDEMKAFMMRRYLDGMDQELNEDELVTDIITEQQSEMNPNRKRYSLGQEIVLPGGLMVVVDFDSDGEPLVMPKGSTNATK